MTSLGMFIGKNLKLSCKNIALCLDFSPPCTSYFSALLDFFRKLSFAVAQFVQRKVVRSKYRFSSVFLLLQILNYNINIHYSWQINIPMS